MKIIGITGSSGSGKTTLSNILKNIYDFEIIDADKVARDLAIPGTEYLKEIKKQIGEDVFYKEGVLNRKALAEKIYTNKKDLEILNELTFKYVVEEIKKNIQIAGKKGNKKYIVIDAPLLFEANLDKECDCTIALVADENIKIQRICKRDNLSIETAKKRLEIQQSDEYYMRKADFVVKNNNENELEKNIKIILEKIITK